MARSTFPTPRSAPVRRVLLAALVAIGAYAPALSQSGGMPPEVIVQTATQTEFFDRIEAVGTLRAAESVLISANVTETVRRIGFDDGEQVRRGQMLVQFDASEEDASVAEAQAAVSIAREEYERAQRLFDRNALAESELLARGRDLSVAQARLDGATAQGSDRVIRAPFDGVVGLRTISRGATVRPGDPIVRIDDISELNLDFPVPATRLTTLQPGMRVTARASALPERTFEGDVQTIDSFIDPATRSVLVRAVLPNADGVLKPGLLMTVEVRSAPRRSVTVDEGALVPSGREAAVYVVGPAEGDGTAVVERRPVVTGARRVGEVEIVSGLRAGERVVTHGTLKVRSGASVRPVSVNDADGSPLGQFLSRAKR
ncbi:MAG: efflux RND transporter periplasmic adaptor subunit [Litorimonas sp.]